MKGKQHKNHKVRTYTLYQRVRFCLRQNKERQRRG